MEDPSKEVEIEEVGESGKSCRLGWMVNAGLNLGKKAIITSIVASSVPVVLPPLVVVSALGFAFSVPYGVMFVSYVGTEKLMSKLLPPPPIQSPEIEYEAVLLQEEEGAVDMDEWKKYQRGIHEVSIELEDEEEEEAGDRSEKVSVEVGDLVADGDGGLSVHEVIIELEDDEEEVGGRVENVEVGDVGVESDDGLNVHEVRVDKEEVGARGEKESVEVGDLGVDGDNGLNVHEVTVELEEDEEEEGVGDEKVSIEIVGLGVDGDDGLNGGGGNKEESEERLLETSKDENQSMKAMEGNVAGIDDTRRYDDDDVVFAPESTVKEDRTERIVEGPAPAYEPLMENEGEKDVTDTRGRDETVGQENADVEKNVDAVKETVAESRQVDLEKSSSKERGRRGKKKAMKAPKAIARKKGEEDDKKQELPRKDEELSEETKISSKERGPAVVQETRRNESRSISSDKEQVGEVLTNDDGGVIERSLEKGKKPVMKMPDAVVQEKRGDKISSVSSEKEHAAAGLEGVMPGSQIVISDEVGNIDGSLEKEHKPVVLEELPKGQSAEDSAASDVSLGSNKKTGPSAGVLVSETAKSVPANDKESYSQLRMVANGGEQSVELATLYITPELKHEEVIPLLKGNVDSSLHSNEAALHDEDVWKKIDAVREIVGFKALRQPSYFEELKALYLFTGIEPPSPSTASSDLLEFDNKLSFLMSVIGLK